MERQRDAERTRAEILEAATHEFAEHGYSGARVDVIAERTRTTKRMLYYYFENKAGLYTAVLERAYGEIRERESQLDVEGLDPVAAIRRLAELTFDHHESHPDFIRLVSIENIHYARHIARSEILAGLANPALEALTRILDRGRAAGRFRDDVDPASLATRWWLAGHGLLSLVAQGVIPGSDVATHSIETTVALFTAAGDAPSTCRASVTRAWQEWPGRTAP